LKTVAAPHRLRLLSTLALALLWLGSAAPMLAGELDSRLIKAAEQGDTAAVRGLLAQGADINARDDVGYTPLHNACYYGHLETATLLIQRGADVGALNHNQATPLHVLAAEFRIEGPGRLVPGSQRALVNLLLSHGADVNAHSAGYRWTPLLAALFSGNDEVAQALVERGADVTVWDEINQRTALSAAVSKSSLEVIRIMLAKGADAVTVSGAGRTPLQDVAIFRRNLANVIPADARQRTPSQQAAFLRLEKLEAWLTAAEKSQSFARGMTAVGRQDWAQASDLFARAYRLESPHQDSSLLFNLALSETKIPGRELSALRHFAQYLETYPSAPNAAAVRQQFPRLKAPLVANLDLIADRMKQLASQFPNEEGRLRACTYLARVQARAAHFREALETARAGNCANRMDSSSTVVVLKDISDSQARASDFEGAYQTLRQIESFVQRTLAFTTLIETMASQNECARLRSLVPRSIREGILPASPQTPYEQQTIDEANQRAAECGRQPRRRDPDAIPRYARDELLDVRKALQSLAALDKPDDILKGLAAYADQIHYALLALSEAGF